MSKKKDKKEHNGVIHLEQNSELPEMTNKYYESELKKLQIELVKLQYWIKKQGLKLVILFEGRDAAGKGSIITKITERLNPRGCKVVALEKPSDREKSQWYFQRYVAHLPSAGEIVIFDRSWYNRAGVERVMGFCSDDEYWEFLRTCPEFERMITNSGIVLLKYWISVSEAEQEKRFRDRTQNPLKVWKFSPMDLASFDKWDEYSRAKDEMFKFTDTKQCPWWVVESEDKRKSRLNCIAHILESVDYEDVIPKPFELPPRQTEHHYLRPNRDNNSYVPERY